MVDSNVFNPLEANKSGAEAGDDIDSILQYLEDKNKKKEKGKLPLISTKDKFYKPP